MQDQLSHKLTVPLVLSSAGSLRAGGRARPAVSTALAVERRAASSTAVVAAIVTTVVTTIVASAASKRGGSGDLVGLAVVVRRAAGGVDLGVDTAKGGYCVKFRRNMKHNVEVRTGGWRSRRQGS